MRVWPLLLVIAAWSVSPVAAVSQRTQGLRSDFGYAYELYRSAYTDFVIARSLYEDIPTFAHEESLTSKAAAMLEHRDMVWLTYFEVLKQEVTDLDYINLDDKQFITATISAQQQELTGHKAKLATIPSRKQLLDTAKEVNQRANLYNSIGNYARSRLKQGCMDLAIAEMVKYAGVLETATAQQLTDEIVKTARLRGLNDVIDQAGKLKGKLTQSQQAWMDYARSYGGADYYENVVEAYRPLHQELATLYSLLAELSQGLEL